MILPDCTVIIPTRNRPKDLFVTADFFVQQLLRNTPIIVVDDCSDDSKAISESLTKLTNCRLIVHKNRTGQAGARNTGIQASSTRYCLLLDDDCHIDTPCALVDFLNSAIEPNTAIWRFETIREYDGYRDGIPESFPRTKIGSFIGFGALLDNTKVRHVGGFRDVLRYRKEEEDLSVRLFKVGYDITYVPGIRFIHRHLSNARRTLEFMQEYEWLNTRNTILYYGLNFPPVVGLLEGVARSLKATMMSPSEFRFARFKGVIAGIVEYIRNIESCTPMTYSQAKEWRRFRKSVLARMADMKF